LARNGIKDVELVEAGWRLFNVAGQRQLYEYGVDPRIVAEAANVVAKRLSGDLVIQVMQLGMHAKLPARFHFLSDITQRGCALAYQHDIQARDKVVLC